MSHTLALHAIMNSQVRPARLPWGRQSREVGYER